MTRFRRLENIIRAVVWPLLHPAAGAQALLGNAEARETAASGHPTPAPVPPSPPAWVTVQESQRVLQLGLGYVTQAGGVDVVRYGRVFFLSRGGERFKRATLFSRDAPPDGYVNQIAVRVLDYKASGIIANLCTLTLQNGADWVQSGEEDAYRFEDPGQIVLVEVLQNSGAIDIHLEFECPVYT